MNYLEQVRIQEKIASFKDQLREKISYLDECGNRKLNSYYFLSAEVAAYKLLNSWNKRMLRGEDIIDDEVRYLLSLIEALLNEEYEDYSEYEAEISMPLWYRLISGAEGDSYIEFNKEVFIVASMAEMSKGTDLNDTLAATINYFDLEDPNIVSYAYSLAHDFLISMDSEAFETFAKRGFGKDLSKGELYKFHFNLFQ